MFKTAPRKLEWCGAPHFMTSVSSHTSVLQGAFEAALDAYLSVQPAEAANSRKLIEAWQAAARIAEAHVPARGADVAAQAAKNMEAAGEARAAAAMYVRAGDRAAAVRAVAAAGMAAEAAEAAGGDASLIALATQHAAQHGPARTSAGAGVTVADLDEQARRGNWSQARLSLSQLRGRDLPVLRESPV